MGLRGKASSGSGHFARKTVDKVFSWTLLAIGEGRRGGPGLSPSA